MNGTWRYEELRRRGGWLVSWASRAAKKSEKKTRLERLTQNLARLLFFLLVFFLSSIILDSFNPKQDLLPPFIPSLFRPSSLNRSLPRFFPWCTPPPVLFRPFIVHTVLLGSLPFKHTSRTTSVLEIIQSLSERKSGEGGGSCRALGWERDVEHVEGLAIVGLFAGVLKDEEDAAGSGEEGLEVPEPAAAAEILHVDEGKRGKIRSRVETRREELA